LRFVAETTALELCGHNGNQTDLEQVQTSQPIANKMRFRLGGFKCDLIVADVSGAEV
jgi:hypothetical protein